MTNSVTIDATAHAVAAVPREHYTAHPRLGRVRQTTARWAIERDIRRADISAGMRVLEIGTGTGYSGALLAELVGLSGHVVSVDIDSALTDRAAQLHVERGVGNLTLVTGDGHRGAVEHGPYDAVIGWATPTAVPSDWVAQCVPGAVISTPIYLAPVARAVGHIRTTVADHRSLTPPKVGGAVYVDMGTEINTSLGVPMYHLDGTAPLDRGGLVWVSVAWRGRYDGHDPTATLALLRSASHVEPVELGDTDEQRALAWRDFRAYCVGRDAINDPSSLTTYGTTAEDAPVSGVGFSSGRNAAILTADGELRTDRADSPALAKLRDHYTWWKQADRPGVDHLTGTFVPVVGGWAVRAGLPA